MYPPSQHTTNKQQFQRQWSSTPIYRVHETQRVHIPQAFLSSSATVPDIAKQWGESGNENEQTETDNVADENAVMAQALLNDVWKLVGYISAKEMRKIPDSITH